MNKSNIRSFLVGMWLTCSRFESSNVCRKNVECLMWLSPGVVELDYHLMFPRLKSPAKYTIDDGCVFLVRLMEALSSSRAVMLADGGL